jgi:DNA-binding PadR family transcriptional regulator
MYAILGILNIASASGYDVKKYFDTVMPGIWHENYGHIYPTLRRLSEDGLIRILAAEPDTTKIRYAITETGQAELLTWLRAQTDPQPARSEFMLKLLFSDQMAQSELAAMIHDYGETFTKSLSNYRLMEKELTAGIPEISPTRTPFLLSVLRSGIIHCESMIAWCDETSERLLGKQSDPRHQKTPKA